MRGKIIHYNTNEGGGIIMAEGRQYPFTIAAWTAEAVPAAGKTVEITIEEDSVTAVSVIGDDVLLKEKAAELGGKLGSALGNIDLSSLKAGASSLTTGENSTAAGSVVERYGVIMLAAYGLFLIGSLVFNAVSISIFGNSMGRSLFEIASLLSQTGANGGGGIKLLLVLAYFGVALPIIWRDRRAWLALLLPALATAWAIISVLRIMNSMGSEVAGAMGNVFSIGFGLYLTIAAAVVLAAGGAKRFMKNS